MKEPDILEYAEMLHCQELHMVVDKPTGLKAVIAIHNTVLGPALGGCRLKTYPSTTAAVIDAIRLAEGMTYKAAMANLALGGGKMVVLQPQEIVDRKALFKAVGRFVNILQGRYITATDSGVEPEDMDMVATETPYVTTKAHGPLAIANSGIMTAQGMKRGLQAAVKFKLGSENLKGLRISVQGLGHVGYQWVKVLAAEGADIIAYDINPQALKLCVDEFGVKTVSDLDSLLKLEVDVFSPCAYGAILNDDTIPKIKAPIIAGGANNQLALPQHGVVLHERNVLYVPDYVINAGALIYVAIEFGNILESQAMRNIDRMYDTAMEIFERSKKENQPTSELADRIARERIQSQAIQKDGLTVANG